MAESLDSTPISKTRAIEQRRALRRVGSGGDVCCHEHFTQFSERVRASIEARSKEYDSREHYSPAGEGAAAIGGQRVEEGKTESKQQHFFAILLHRLPS